MWPRPTGIPRTSRCFSAGDEGRIWPAPGDSWCSRLAELAWTPRTRAKGKDRDPAARAGRASVGGLRSPAMPGPLQSRPLRALLDAACRSGDLILACGPEGVSANLVGRVAVVRHGAEDRLDVDDGTHHVHMDWARVTRVEVGTSDGEGLLVLHGLSGPLLKLYRPEGPYPAEVGVLANALKA